MYCENCGKNVIKDSTFCDNCGFSVIKNSEPVKKINSSQQKNSVSLTINFPHLSKKTLLLMVSGLFLVLFIWGVKNLYTLYWQKVNSTEYQLQATQKELEDIKTEIKQGQEKQEKQISEAKKEISFLKNKNEQLFGSLNKQNLSNSLFSGSSLVSTKGKHVVKVVCLDAYNNINQGSGVIVSKTPGNTTLVMTNQHVIPRTYTPDLTYPCLIAYSSSPTTSFTNFYYANPVYWADRASISTMRNYDFGYLEIKQEIDISGDEVIPIYGTSLILADNQRPTICKVDELAAGKDLIILGYASVGGDYLTVKEGIISGFDGVYITTSAKIEQGDSGGGAFLADSGCLIGMPTFSISGKIESLGRILALSYISSFIISFPELRN